MIQMKALIGFADRELATEHNPNGVQAANRSFRAPNADVAKRLETEGLAERTKAPSPPKT